MPRQEPSLSCQKCSTRERGVFCQLSENHLEEIEKAKTTNHYRPHQVIFYEGNRPYGLYCVSEGKIKIYKSDTEGHQQIVRLAGAGDILGYRALISGDSYEATAETLEPSRICFFDKATFFKVLEIHPMTAFHVMKLLAKDLGNAEKKALSITHKNVRERLAELLLIFKKRYGKKVNEGILLDINLTREELSEFIGTTQESVIRTLSDFRQEGLVTLNGRSVIIKNIQKLVTIANLPE